MSDIQRCTIYIYVYISSPPLHYISQVATTTPDMDLAFLLNHDPEPAPVLASFPSPPTTITIAVPPCISPPQPPVASIEVATPTPCYSSSSDEEISDDRRRRLRQVGQKHRNKQRFEIDALFNDVTRLKLRNAQLALQIPPAAQYIYNRGGEFEVSAKLSEIIGVTALSGCDALLILEFLTHRRHLNNELSSPEHTNINNNRNIDIPSFRLIHSRWAKHESQLPPIPAPAGKRVLFATAKLQVSIPRRICIARESHAEDRPTNMAICRSVGAIAT